MDYLEREKAWIEENHPDMPEIYKQSLLDLASFRDGEKRIPTNPQTHKDIARVSFRAGEAVQTREF